MRQRYKNRAIKLISLGILLNVAFIVLIILRKHGIPDGVVAVGAVVLGAVGSILYVQGCVALAEAKGYTGAEVVAIIIISYCCFLPLMIFIPLVLLFGIRDKTSDK